MTRKMRMTPLFVVSLAALLSASLASAKNDRNFTAHLSGGEEVPEVDTRARGQAVFNLNREGDTLYYKLTVANIENVLMAHIHVGPAGENGPVVVWLYPPEGPPPDLIEGRFSGVLAVGTITTDDLVGPLVDDTLDDLLAEMLAGNAYVNVHTDQNRGGEVRGQIKASKPTK